MRTFVLSVFLSLAIAPSAMADCPMQKAQVTGTVQARKQPVEGAVIEVRWDEQRTRNVSAQTRSEADGSFQVDLSIDGFDGRTLMAKEKCGYLPGKVEIEVRRDGHADYQRSFKFADLSKPLDIQLRAR